MRRPGTRHFIGPLTPVQQERRRRARYRANDAAEIASGRGVTFIEGLRIAAWEHKHRFSSLLYP